MRAVARYDERRGSAASRGYGSDWQHARVGHLNEHPLCVHHLAKGQTVAARVVDHIVPHRGDRALFWDAANWQSLCSECHDGIKAALERLYWKGQIAAELLRLDRRVPEHVWIDAKANGGRRDDIWHPEWMRPSVVPVTLVCGPPGAGKTTFVRREAGPRDCVVDLDDIGQALSGNDGKAWWRGWLEEAGEQRNRMLYRLGDASARETWDAAWLIVSEPVGMRRAWWRRKLGAARVVVMAVPAAVCLRRLVDAGEMMGDERLAAVERWWSRYTPAVGDEVVTG